MGWGVGTGVGYGWGLDASAHPSATILRPRVTCSSDTGLDSDSLRLPAIYGLSIGASGLLFKALVGDWVDRTPRWKTVIVALAIQNISVALCAGVVILLLRLGPMAAAKEDER